MEIDNNSFLIIINLMIIDLLIINLILIHLLIITKTLRLNISFRPVHFITGKKLATKILKEMIPQLIVSTMRNCKQFVKILSTFLEIKFYS